MENDMKKIKKPMLLNLIGLFSIIVIFSIILISTTTATENVTEEAENITAETEDVTAETVPITKNDISNSGKETMPLESPDQPKEWTLKPFIVTGIILVLILLLVSYLIGKNMEKKKTKQIRDHYKQMMEEYKGKIIKQKSEIKEFERKYQNKIRILEEKNKNLEEKNKETLKNKKEIQEEINKEWERTIEIMKNDHKKDVLKYFMNALDSTQKIYGDYKGEGKKEAEDIEIIYKTMSNALEHLGIKTILPKGKDKLSGYKIDGKVVRNTK